MKTGYDKGFRVTIYLRVQETEGVRKMELEKYIREALQDKLYEATLSNPVDKERAAKVKIRAVSINGQELWQETLYRGTQVFHSNWNQEETEKRLVELLKTSFRQGQMETGHFWGTVLIGKKGTVTIKKKRKQEGLIREESRTHNREKNYILKEGTPVDFLVELGVMTGEGRVVKARFDKFRQINRYLEFVKDVLPALPLSRRIRIIDFGCGKSYLTFAMYYYLHDLQKLDIEMIGLDLKEDVISSCRKLAQKLGYQFLHFEKGDIAEFDGRSGADMVVTLHACDTATDYAIKKAVDWNASVILSVPCCQHEVNRQINCRELSGILKYGIIRERMSALITDALRAELLDTQGYDAQILEFIDMEHTPKNLLIRAVKRKGMKPVQTRKRVDETAAFLNINPTLQRLLDENRS